MQTWIYKVRIAGIGGGAATNNEMVNSPDLARF